jgi:putative membrane protein
MAHPLFTDAERERIRLAVDAAESRTAGEIVPYVVVRSGRYEIAAWRGGALGALVAAAVALAVAWTYDGWGLGWLYTAWAMAFVMTLGGVLGALLVWLTLPLRRTFAGPARMAERVHRRAESAFLEEGVFDTRDRTGILLFVSLMEHRIEVIGDKGINAAVAPEEWGEVVARIRKGVQSGHLADGLVDAIGMCGELLHRSGVGIRPDDTDELSDGVRVRDQ